MRRSPSNGNTTEQARTQSKDKSLPLSARRRWGVSDKMFPIQSNSRDSRPHPLKIPWPVAELAYSTYARRHGRNQSLEQLAERGGFCSLEMDDFLPDWRERCDELSRLRASLAAVAKERDKAKGINMESLRLFDYLLNHSNARVLLSDGFKKDASDLVAQIRSKP